MNWNSPRADEVDARAVGLKLDSIFAVASRYSKLVPVLEAACLMAPAMRARDGSMPAAAGALEASTAMYLLPAVSRRHTAAGMVNEGLIVPSFRDTPLGVDP